MANHILNVNCLAESRSSDQSLATGLDIVGWKGGGVLQNFIDIYLLSLHCIDPL